MAKRIFWESVGAVRADNTFFLKHIPELHFELFLAFTAFKNKVVHMRHPFFRTRLGRACKEIIGEKRNKINIGGLDVYFRVCVWHSSHNYYRNSIADCLCNLSKQKEKEIKTPRWRHHTNRSK